MPLEYNRQEPPDEDGCVNGCGDAFFERADGEYVCQDCYEAYVDRLDRYQEPYDTLQERDL